MLILASQSPRRKALLEANGFAFKVVPSNVIEEENQSMSPTQYVRHLAKLKAEDVFQRYPHDLILAADTIVVYGQEILGKPKDDDDAFRMLKKLSGQRHYVYTAVCIKDEKQEASWLSYAEVVFKSVEDQDLWTYVQTKEPMDKAGAYAIQGLGSFLVQSYYGNYHSIVGLPILEVVERLKTFNRRHFIKEAASI